MVTTLIYKLVKSREVLFDPRLPEHHLKINPDHFQALLTDVQKSIPKTGFQQFWCVSLNPKHLQSVVDARLCNYILFSHKTWNSEMHLQVADPSFVDCHHSITGMKLSYSQVTAIEATTQSQVESELWVM